MPKQLILGCKGLFTSVNRLALPQGALSEATNLVVRRPDLIETRPGLPAAGASGTWTSIANNDAAIIHLALDSTTQYPLISAGGKLISTVSPYTTYTDLGSFSGPDQLWPQFADAKRCTYFTSAGGVYRMDAGTATPILAGIQKPLGVSTASSAGTGAAFTAPGSVAYRSTLLFTDAKGNVYESAPSPRGIYRWAGATNAVDVTVRIPASLTTSHKIRLYRSSQVTVAEDEPSDETQLVYERYITSGEVSAKSIVITDIVPDVMRGPSAYFNPSQQGIGQSNERPPHAYDIAWHKDTMFYANAYGPRRLILRLLSVNSGLTNGLVANDTVTIAGTTYTAKASGATGDQFNLVTSFTGAQANVQGTAINLVNAINASSNNTTVYAYYLSGADDPAGIFMIEGRTAATSTFAATTSAGAETCWAPELPTSGTTVSDNVDVGYNRLYFSKPGEPESVPLLNYLEVGSKTDQIVRVFRLRESLYVFKYREGIFRITGGPGNFSVVEHDSTVRLFGKNTLAALGNELYLLTDSGVVATSDAGTRRVSGPIDESLRYVLLSVGSNTASHAAADEAAGLYVLWVETASAMEAWVYSSRVGASGAWTRWDFHATASTGGSPEGATGPGVLWVAKTAERKLRRSASGQTATDFRDDSGTPISTAMTWPVQVASSPGVLKQWTRADFILQAGTVTTGTAAFSTELDTSETTVTLAPASGAFLTTSPVPTSKQLGAFLNVSLDTAEESKKFVCGGLVLTYEEGGDNAGR